MAQSFLNIILVFFVSIFFGVITQVPKKHLLHVGIVGAAGRVIYELVFCMDNSNMYYATFFASLAITIISHILARVLKTPVTVFLIAGVIAMIPGYYFYLMVYNFVKMETDLAFEYLVSTIMLSGAIAVAIFLVDSLYKFAFDLRKKRC